jgi:hypothetical protein
VIFYTNGIDVLDADHQKINTQQLKAFFSCIQPALVIPINDSAYIITTASPDSGVYFYTLIKRDSFVIVDPEGIKLLNGYIKTPQNITGTTEGQHAVNHQNNIFTWFTARQFNGLYNLFLCTENGVVCCPKTSKTYKSTTVSRQSNVE